MGRTNGTTKKDNSIATTDKKVSIYMAIQPAIIRMHELGNNKAISKDFAAGCGAGEVAFTSWVNHIDELYDIVLPWGNKFNNKKVTDDELAVIYKTVFPKWRQICRVGETECNGHNNMFIRESDAVRICGFVIKHGKTEKGSIDVANGKKVFRKEIETMLGIRLAQNEVLSDKDYDIIKTYEKAESNKDKAENRLDGYTRNGQEVKGLRALLKDAEAEVKKITDIAKKLKADKAMIESLTAEADKVVTDLKSQVTQAEKQLNNANATIKELKKDYEAIMARIEAIK